MQSLLKFSDVSILLLYLSIRCPIGSTSDLRSFGFHLSSFKNFEASISIFIIKSSSLGLSERDGLLEPLPATTFSSLLILSTTHLMEPGFSACVIEALTEELTLPLVVLFAIFLLNSVHFALKLGRLLLQLEH